MKITADNAELRVDYREAGVVYNKEPGDYRFSDRSTWPFESEVVPIGTTFTPPSGACVVNIAELRGAVEAGAAPE